MGKSNSKQTYDAFRSFSIILICCICLCILLRLFFCFRCHVSVTILVVDKMGLPRFLLSCTSTVHKRIFLRLVCYNFFLPLLKKLNEIAQPKNNLICYWTILCVINEFPIWEWWLLQLTVKIFAILQLTVNFLLFD